MKVIRSKERGFAAFLALIAKRGAASSASVEPVVRRIIKDVRARGDEALSEYTERFDGVDTRGRVRVEQKDMERAAGRIPRKDLKLIELAASRIESFHRRQVPGSWAYRDKEGVRLGVKLTPMERAGIYVPGGRAAYPSTVLMNAIPARVAGVGTVVMVTPPARDGSVNAYVLAAAMVAGVSAVYRAGGAQAIAALAFGTETVQRVDKITGPGNIYVATAKRLVYGHVDIDMIAGPSEILIINDGSGEPSWMAADLLAQAEHDELASSMLVTTSEPMAEAVVKEVGAALKRLKRRSIASASIERYGAAIVADSLEDAARISNEIAPEHLELFVREPEGLLGLIRNAGAVFLGAHTPEAAGDYLAGPNHTLPTGGAARFSSPLGVEDFVKRTSVMSFSAEAISNLGGSIIRFAEIEGLYGHALSVGARTRGRKGAARRR
jgi:histidinol dehydrogenase